MTISVPRRRGEWLGRVDVPDRFTMLAITEDLILGVDRDEFDGEAVALYLNVRRPGRLK